VTEWFSPSPGHKQGPGTLLANLSIPRFTCSSESCQCCQWHGQTKYGAQVGVEETLRAKEHITIGVGDLSCGRTRSLHVTLIGIRTGTRWFPFPLDRRHERDREREREKERKGAKKRVTSKIASRPLFRACPLFRAYGLVTQPRGRDLVASSLCLSDTHSPKKMSGKEKVCQCYKCRAERGLEPLKVTAARSARRKDGHYAGCKHRHHGWCHCRNVLTEWEMMHQ
jgi:hypothetical protein